MEYIAINSLIFTCISIILVAVHRIYFETVEDIHKVRMIVLNNLQENYLWKCFDICKYLMELLKDETAGVQNKT
jgi:hypothetical protein